ncbi:MAG: hypothetical protein ACI85O_002004 [Saprospiraceae bacterium]|jgi:hypothetical protein
MVGQVLETKVSFSFGGWQLGDAITEIGNSYDIQFVYSPDKIPVTETVTVSVEEVPLSEGLEELLADFPVKYVVVGERIVFKRDRLKKIRSYTRMKLPEAGEPWVMRTPIENEDAEVYTAAGDTLSFSARMPILDSVAIKPSLKLLMQEKTKQIRRSGGNSFIVPKIDLSFLDDSERERGMQRAAQVSVAPGVSSNFRDAKEMTNRVSFNMTWGVNGGVNGGEIGLLGNTVNGNVQGAQIAGLVNITKGNVIGTQFAGLVNHSKGYISGLQISGLRNRVQNGNGVQVSGLWNNVKENYVGLQLAGLTNRTKGKNFGWQVAGLGNNAGDGRTQVQIAGLFNKAKEVQIAQVGVINVADRVGGIQVGLINISDTASLISFGLLNFIRKGYNRLELSQGKVFQWNANYKFGTTAFYNIIQTSLHSEETKFSGVPANWSEENVSWGLGYGLGTSFRTGNRLRWNFETVALHINEKARWSNDENWLAQLKMTVDIRLFKKFSIFAGGVLNGSASTRINHETGTIGTDLPQEGIFATGDIVTDNGKIYDLKMWSSWTVGMRF